MHYLVSLLFLHEFIRLYNLKLQWQPQFLLYLCNSFVVFQVLYMFIKRNCSCICIFLLEQE